MISYGFIVFGVITAIAIVIVKPQKSSMQFVYDSTSTAQTEPIEFPFEMKIENKAENLSYIDFYLGNDSLNKYQYDLKLYTGDKIYFEHEYTDYASNIIRVPVGEKIELGESLTLSIDCKQCKNVLFDLYGSDGKSYIANNEEKVLQTVEVGKSTNYGYLWYAALFIAIGFTLLPLAKEEYEKK